MPPGRRAPAAEFVAEEVVVRTAQIIGAQSGAQRALDQAAALRAKGKKVVFVRTSGSIFVIDANDLHLPVE